MYRNSRKVSLGYISKKFFFAKTIESYEEELKQLDKKKEFLVKNKDKGNGNE